MQEYIRPKKVWVKNEMLSAFFDNDDAFISCYLFKFSPFEVVTFEADAINVVTIEAVTINVVRFETVTIEVVAFEVDWQPVYFCPLISFYHDKKL
jgi:hypothetical protein